MRKGLQPVNPMLLHQKEATVIAQKLYNPNCEAEDYRSIVLVARTCDFVVWNYNSQTCSFSRGDYCDGLTKARDLFNSRGLI